MANKAHIAFTLIAVGEQVALRSVDVAGTDSMTEISSLVTKFMDATCFEYVGPDVAKVSGDKELAVRIVHNCLLPLVTTMYTGDITDDVSCPDTTIINFEFDGRDLSVYSIRTIPNVSSTILHLANLGRIIGVPNLAAYNEIGVKNNVLNWAVKKFREHDFNIPDEFRVEHHIVKSKQIDHNISDNCEEPTGDNIAVEGGRIDANMVNAFKGALEKASKLDQRIPMDEKMSPSQRFGGALISLGLKLVNRGRKAIYVNLDKAD